jgi:hypothetical protein
MRAAADEMFEGEDERPVCICGKVLEPWELESWEREERGGMPLCIYHAHQLDKDEQELLRELAEAGSAVHEPLAGSTHAYANEPRRADKLHCARRSACSSIGAQGFLKCSHLCDTSKPL